jgi:glucokinase
VWRALREVLEPIGAQANEVAGIGLGIPGQVDPHTGTVRLAVNLNLESFALGPTLARQTGIPVAVENDVRLAAIGVYEHLQETDPVQSLAYLSVGTGIAAGIILDGVLYRGANGMAGEIGHTLFEPGGERCHCGLYGCLETIASGPAISHLAAPFFSGGGASVPTTAQVYAVAQTGNGLARQLVERIGTHLGRAIHWLIMTYDVERLVVGGGVSAAGSAFWLPITTELAHLREQSLLAHDMLSESKIVLFSGEENPGIWGAITLAEQVAGRIQPTIPFEGGKR